MRALAVVAMLATAAMAIACARAAQCGSQAGGATCPNCLCCSQFGWCGSTPEYCGDGCQSHCSGCGSTPVTPYPFGGVSSIVSPSLFNQILLHRNDPACQAKGFYTYDAFIAAATAFPGFGTTGSIAIRKREIAAFLAQTSHETTGGWPTAPNGPYTWGYCYKPIGADLLGNPNLVVVNPTVSFETAMWFWMTEQPPKPSSHAVITGQWNPSATDRAAGRVPGFGVITNIINGGMECFHGYDERVQDRIGFYKRYCKIFGISYGDNLDCYKQRPFA
ncbi:basic endochitinase A-like isoform X2 [Triticum aestivum]|uniref:basic endochitinase A-like isoform X2 n=1 Tax=Triticum aestivum TaxID=4565 RepID=UPI001D00DBFE|nr:basic endochitinase A-like isoform X2 [Triticum aestivum]